MNTSTQGGQRPPQSPILTTDALGHARRPTLVNVGPNRFVVVFVSLVNANIASHEFNAADGYIQLAHAVQDERGSIWDFDGDGEPLYFKSWRELVKLETAELEQFDVVLDSFLRRMVERKARAAFVHAPHNTVQ